jgi:hypothetical protein
VVEESEEDLTTPGNTVELRCNLEHNSGAKLNSSPSTNILVTEANAANSSGLRLQVLYF